MNDPNAADQPGSAWHAVPDRTSYPPLDQDLDTDVVVVGAGITGLTTAYLLAEAGFEVAVIEADRIASGTTGGTTGKVTSQHGVKYRQLVATHGEDAARGYATVNQQAIETIGVLAAECAPQSSFTRAPAYTYASDEGELAALHEELQVCLSLGLPAEIVPPDEVPIPSTGALRFSGQAHFHPVRYCEGLARSLVERGVRVHESTRATGVRERRDRVHVRCGEHLITAAHAVIATLLPFTDRSGAFAKTRPVRAYGLGVRLARPAPPGMYVSVGAPVRSIRPWPEAGDTGMIVVGERYQTGHRRQVPARWNRLGAWAADHFEVESIDHRWSAQDYATADGLPYIGRSPLTARTYVATGFEKWGLTNGTAAARILTDLILGADNPHAEFFDVGRIGGTRGLSKILARNAKVAVSFVGDRIGARTRPAIAGLGLGEGKVLREGGRDVAAYRLPDGAVLALEPACTHLGCYVRWNAAETSWDCPCHGSRFAVTGEVLAGPATRPLEPVEIHDHEDEP